MKEKANSSAMEYDTIDRCRVCGCQALEPLLSFGRTPLANGLVAESDLTRTEATYPLDLVACPECSLVQITCTVPPQVLFSDYAYFSSFSDTMLSHSRRLAQRLIRERHLDSESLVVEIASNDGYMLQNFLEARVPVLGIEPARNVAGVAESRGIATIARFFDADLAKGLRADGRAADVVIANNVLAHVADLHGVVAGIRTLLKPDGIAVIETPYVADTVDDCEFDTIYHEHLCYYSLHALERLFSLHSLVIMDAEHVGIHGGSLRLFVAPAEAGSPGRSVVEALEAEAAWLGPGLENYRRFAERVGNLQETLRDLLFGLKSRGKRIAGYGAAAKASTLLNTCGIGREILDFVVDRSPHKQGRYLPGCHVPIYRPEALLERIPDYSLLLAWNLTDEILAQQAEYQRRGGRFIVPIPEIRFPLR